MPDEEYTKRTFDSYASFLENASDITVVRQLLLGFFVLATSSSATNDFVDSIFLTSSITREEYEYRRKIFLNKLRKKLDLKK